MSCNGSRAVDILKCWLFKKKLISSPDQWELRRHAFLRCTNWGGGVGRGVDFVSKCVIPWFQTWQERRFRVRRAHALFVASVLCRRLTFTILRCEQRSVRREARGPLSFRATFFADGRNWMSTCCEPYGGGSSTVPELSNDCAQPSVSGVTRLIHQTNNSGSLTFFFLAERNYFFSPRTEALSLSPLFFLNNKKKNVLNLSHGFGEFNNNKKWRLSRCPVWSCCVIKNIHVNTGD